MTKLTTKSLPKEIPLLVRTGTIIFPKAKIPLIHDKQADFGFLKNSFEEGGYIGIIQAAAHLEDKDMVLFCFGVVWKVVEVLGEKEEKMAVILEGICRFELKSLKKDKESNTVCAKVSYTRFKKDLDAEEADLVDRTKLLSSLMQLSALSSGSQDVSLEEFSMLSTDRLLSLIGMSSPFYPSEKQAALEAVSQKDRYNVIFSLLDMASYDTLAHHKLH